MKKGKEKQDSEEEERFPARAFDEPQRHQQNIIPAPGDSSAYPSSVSIIDIGSIKNLIQVCLQLGMNKDEVATKLSVENGIHPGTTHIAWNQLKEEKPELFKDYMEKIILKQMSNLSIDQHHYLPPATLPPSAQPILGVSLNMPDDCLYERYTIPRPFGNDEDSESSSSHPAQKIDHGRGMAMDRNAAVQTQMSHFVANACRPFSSYLPLPMEQEGQIFIEQQGQNFMELMGENIMEQQGPGSRQIFIEQQGQHFKEQKGDNIMEQQEPGSENPPSPMLIDSETESTINADQYRNLPSSDSQSEEES